MVLKTRNGYELREKDQKLTDLAHLSFILTLRMWLTIIEKKAKSVIENGMNLVIRRANLPFSILGPHCGY